MCPPYDLPSARLQRSLGLRVTTASEHEAQEKRGAKNRSKHTTSELIATP